MNGDPLIRRITDRLAVDPELRLEVARELQTHLDDSIAEFRAGGAGEDEARSSAEKALGDPAELAEQLWLANRRRLRFRAVARWAAGAALLPAAAAVLIVLALSLRHGGMLFYQPRSVVPEELASGLTDEQRFLLYGDPNARSPLESAKSISDRWPDNPVYYGNYVAHILGHVIAGLDANRTGELLALAGRGEELDPGNAYYDYLKAAWFFRLSSELADDSNRAWENPGAMPATMPGWRVTIRDEALFRRGLEALRRGLAKPELSPRTLEMTGLRESLLPQSRRLSDVVAKTRLETQTLMPGLSGMRAIARTACAHAVDRAAQGDSSAIELVRAAQRLGDQLGANAQICIELLVAKSIRETGLIGLEQVARELKQEALAASALQERRREAQVYRDLRARARDTYPDYVRQAGMFWSMIMPALPDYQVEFEPMRTTEAFVFFEVALFLLLVGLTLAATAFGAAAIWGMLFRRGGGKPILLFVGWRRLGQIVLVSIVLPLAAYACYAWWQIARPGAYGVNYSLDRVSAEVGALLCGIFALLLIGTYRAVRRRCLEIGLEAPAPLTLRRRWAMTSVGALAAVGLIVYVVVWWAGPQRIRSDTWPGVWGGPAMNQFLSNNQPISALPAGLILAVPFLLLTAAWAFREGCAILVSKAAAFRRAFFRSAMPILCSAVIVVGLAVGGLLTLGESLAARRVTGLAALSLTDEIARCNYRTIQDQFRARHAKDMAELAGAEPVPAFGASTSSKP